MASEQEALAQSIEASKELFLRYVDGFDDSSRTAQAPGLPNHLAWCLGHCSLTMHRACERCGSSDPLPADEFITGDGTLGDTEKFDTESISFSSTPIDDASKYPSRSRAIQIFKQACDRLASVVRDVDSTKLDETVPWGSMETSVRALISRMCFHNGTHCGQIVDLRRALGIGGIFRPAR